jgi:hypothetical protein
MPNNKILSYALIVFGLAFCLIYPLAVIWPSGWAWHEGSPASSDYFMMIAGVYVVLGIFMIRAAKDPAANVSLVWFVVWSSVAHAAVMAVESFRTPMMMGHLDPHLMYSAYARNEFRRLPSRTTGAGSLSVQAHACGGSRDHPDLR